MEVIKSKQIYYILEVKIPGLVDDQGARGEGWKRSMKGFFQYMGFSSYLDGHDMEMGNLRDSK